MTRLAASVCAAWIALSAGPALAKPTTDETSAAREHYKRGTTLYDLGKYDEAITEFQQAYEIKDDPVLLYNIAQSFRLSNKYQDALRFYKTYLRRAPKASNRDEVETKIADMENLIAQQTRVATAPSVDPIPPRGDKPGVIGAPPTRAETAPTRAETPPPRSEVARTEPPPRVETRPTTTPERNPDPPARVETPPPEVKAETAPPAAESPPKPGRPLLIAGIVVAGVGVAVLGAGVALGVVASGNARKQEMSSTFDPALDSQGRTFGLVGPLLAGVGGALVAGGVAVAVVGVLKGKSAEKEKVSFLPAIGDRYTGAELTLRF